MEGGSYEVIIIFGRIKCVCSERLQCSLQRVQTGVIYSIASSSEYSSCIQVWRSDGMWRFKRCHRSPPLYLAMTTTRMLMLISLRRQFKRQIVWSFYFYYPNSIFACKLHICVASWPHHHIFSFVYDQRSAFLITMMMTRKFSLVFAVALTQTWRHAIVFYNISTGHCEHEDGACEG